MATSYTYRLLKDASWGIVITLGGDLLPGAILPPHALKISEAVWLDIDVGWRPSEEEAGFLKLGVNLVADEIERTCEGKLPIVVRVTGLQYTPSDYQPEGLAAAIAEWIAQQCGVPKPEKMQGDIFLGDRAAPPREYVFGARDRCDETVDRIRTVRDRRYRYIRNFMPERPFTQPNAYKERAYPVLNLMKQLHERHKVTLVLVSHDAVLAAQAQRRIVLEDGRVLKDETE